MGLLLLFLYLMCPQEARLLLMTVEGIEESRGMVRIAVYDSEGAFMDEARLFAYKEIDVSGEGSIQVEWSLPEGKYAFTIYHDVNRDRKLNTGWLGIPSESYGFSNNARGMFGPPSFKECLVEVSKDTTYHHVTIK